MQICEIIIYTTGGALTFDIEATTDNFREKLAESLEAGTVVLDTADGSQLVLNAINVVAVEIKEVYEIPPGLKNPSAYK